MTVTDIIQLMNTPESMNRETTIQLKSLVEEYPYFQTVRMLCLKNLQMEKDLSFPIELRKEALYATDRRTLYLYLEKSKFGDFDYNKLNVRSSEETICNTVSLIDFFLSTNTSVEENAPKEIKKEVLVSTDYISILKAEEEENPKSQYLPMKHQSAIDSFLEKDKQSPVRIKLNDDESAFNGVPVIWEKKDFFGETLAKVYIQQKKYEKAIKILQNLSLQNPEKSTYFASQIEELEKLIINNK